MGQDQSQYLSSDRVDQAQIARRHRAEMHTTRKKKPPAEKRPDAFMKHTEAPNHIRPIREEKKEREKRDDEGITGEFDLKLLVKKPPKQLDSLPSRLMDLPEIPDVESSSSSEEENDRGIFHHEVPALEAEEPEVTNPAAHPVVIDGDCSAGNELRLSDLSPYAKEFPITLVEWYVGLHVGDADRFEIYPLQQGNLLQSFLVPVEAVGKYIFAKAYRNVEDQLRETLYGAAEGGVYDPHIGGPRTALYKPPMKVVRVVSTGLTGPTLIPDAWAYVILKALARGAFTCAILLRDVLREGEIIPLDNNKVSAKARKVPGTLRVKDGHLEFAYVSEEQQQQREPLSGMSSPLGLLSSPKKSEKKNTKSSGRVVSPSPQKIPEEKVSVPLSEVHVRPSKAPETILAVLQIPREFQPENTQDMIRFDVDPAIGRNLALYIVIAFQAAEAAGRLYAKEWKNLKEEGNADEVKLLIQNYLESMTSRQVERVPAFAKMPTTPWEILTKKRRESE